MRQLRVRDAIPCATLPALILARQQQRAPSSRAVSALRAPSFEQG
jgi:hypothetical protein